MKNTKKLFSTGIALTITLFSSVQVLASEGPGYTEGYTMEQEYVGPTKGQVMEEYPAGYSKGYIPKNKPANLKRKHDQATQKEAQKAQEATSSKKRRTEK